MVNRLLAYLKHQLLSFEVIPIDCNVLLGMGVQVLETPGVVIFRDSLQLGHNNMLDIQKPLALQG